MEAITTAVIAIAFNPPFPVGVLVESVPPDVGVGVCMVVDDVAATPEKF
jgi:hypothetical protein